MDIIKCDRWQDKGDTCERCGYVINNNRSQCEQCDRDPQKDEWKY